MRQGQKTQMVCNCSTLLEARILSIRGAGNNTYIIVIISHHVGYAYPVRTQQGEKRVKYLIIPPLETYLLGMYVLGKEISINSTVTGTCILSAFPLLAACTPGTPVPASVENDVFIAFPLHASPVPDTYVLSHIG